MTEQRLIKEVGKVCAEIGLDDWSKRKEALV